MEGRLFAPRIRPRFQPAGMAADFSEKNSKIDQNPRDAAEPLETILREAAPRPATREGVSLLQGLVEQALAGDRDAIGRLLDEHRAWLRLIAQREIGGKLAARLDASDLVQQSCLSALRNFPQFQGRTAGEFAAWLLAIHRRQVYDAIR